MIDVFCNLEEFDDGEGPWCDLTFEVISAKNKWFSKTTTISCVAEQDGNDVGFEATIDAGEWEYHPPKDEDSIPLWWGYVYLSSKGQNSDALIKLMRAFYQIDGSCKFVGQVRCQAVALEGNPTELNNGLVRTKLFFDDGVSEEHYAELFFNLDVPNGYAVLNEKDPEYRAPLMAWLSGEKMHDANVLA